MALACALLAAGSVSIRIRLPLVLAALLFALSFSAQSHAATTESHPAEHARDGFYLQLTWGFGWTHRAGSAEDESTSPPTEYSVSERGASTGGSLLIGMPVRPGLVLGVGGLVSLADAQRYSSNVISVDSSEGPSFQTVAMVGPFVDFYPRPALGWHVQGLVGYAKVGDAVMGLGDPSGGLGLLAGVGHDWWIGAHWSVGLLARLSYASGHLVTHPNGSGSSATEHDTVISPSAEVSFTFH